MIYKPGSDIFQNICISMCVHIRAAGSRGAGVAMATPLFQFFNAGLLLFLRLSCTISETQVH